jgi:hypothetical protein
MRKEDAENKNKKPSYNPKGKKNGNVLIGYTIKILYVFVRFLKKAA